MKYLLIIAILALSSCTTCKYEKLITHSIIESLAGHGHCSNYDAMYDDIIEKVKEKGYCEKGEDSFDTKPYMAFLPDGSWNSLGICCYAVVVGDLVGQLPKKWNCDDKTIQVEKLIKDCQSIEVKDAVNIP